MARRGWGGALKHMGVLMGSGATTGLADGQLLERFAVRRDEMAFEALIARHGPMVRHVCSRVLHNEDDADDAFQAVFLVLARRARSIRDPDLLSPWLYGVALRTAREARRRRGMKAMRNDVSEPVGYAEPADRSFARNEESAVLHDEIGRLPENQRRAVVLCHLEGLTHEEAGRRLGTPSGTVGVRLMRARERLRSRLIRRGFAPSLVLFGLPPVLDAAAIRTAASITHNWAAASGEVPAGAASLAAGVLHAMTLTKLKLTAALLGFGILATSAWAYGMTPKAITASRLGIAPRPRAVRPLSAEDRALVEFRKVYRLDEGQTLKRIPPPFAAWRAADIEKRFPFLKQNREQRGHLSTLIYREHEGALEDPSMTFGGSPDDEGRWLTYLLDDVAGFPAQDVEGPDDLLKTPIKGDWIVRRDAPAERRADALGAILWRDCNLQIKLTVRVVERDVIVARGKYVPRPLEGSGDTLELYGATLIRGTGGGGNGDLAELFRWVGRFVEPHRRIVDEVEGRPAGKVSWHLNFRSPFNDQTTREDRGADAVLKHLSEQTGLTFTPERRKIPSLVVERME